MTEGTPLPPAERKQKNATWRALQLAWELGYLIALPAVFFGLGGAYLDKHLGTMPLFLLLGFAFAAFLSFVSIKRRVKTILQ